MNPFLQLRLKHTNSSGFSDNIRQGVPLGGCSPTVAVLGQCEGCVRNNNPGCSVVSRHYFAEIFRLLALSYPECAEGRVVEHHLVDS